MDFDAKLRGVISIEHTDAAVAIYVRSGSSMNWRENMRFFTVTAILLAVLVIPFAIQGLWLILPFAGLELAALWLGLYWSFVRMERMEVIQIGTADVQVLRGRRRLEESYSLPRAWTYLEYNCADNPFDVGRLMFRHRQKRILLGESLGRCGRRALYDVLRRYWSVTHTYGFDSGRIGDTDGSA